MYDWYTPVNDWQQLFTYSDLLHSETSLMCIIVAVVIRGALAQTVPEHPKKEHVFAISTVVGDVFLFQAS